MHPQITSLYTIIFKFKFTSNVSCTAGEEVIVAHLNTSGSKDGTNYEIIAVDNAKSLLAPIIDSMERFVKMPDMLAAIIEHNWI